MPMTGRADAMSARHNRDTRFIDAQVGARLRQRRNEATAKEIARWRCTTRLILARSSGRSASSLFGLTAAAEALGITRKALSDLLNGHTGVSPDMAIRLAKVFGSTADTWLRMQMQHDLWDARQRADKIKALPRPTLLAERAKRLVPKDPSPAALRSAPSPAVRVAVREREGAHRWGMGRVRATQRPPSRAGRG